ncbi:hypothetical protein IOK_18990, partial [Yersinia enterocolitica subsp. palearctica PhRBD_Ye1]
MAEANKAFTIKRLRLMTKFADSNLQGEDRQK